MLDEQLGVEVHPAANLFPMLEGKAFDELVEDIRVNGQKEPVTFYDGQLLDGRNRYRACQVLGREPYKCDIDLVPDVEIDRFTGKERSVPPFDAVSWVLSHNLYRRHLSESQRAMVAAKLAKLKHGDVASQKSDGQICPSITEAAEQLQVSPRSVKNAKTVLREGSEELQKAVESGQVAVSKAATVAKSTPKPKQAEKAKKKAKKKAAKKSTPADKPATPKVVSAVDLLYDSLRTRLICFPGEHIDEAVDVVIDVFAEHGVRLVRK